MTRILPVAVLFFLGCVYSIAQIPVQVDPKTSTLHLLSHPPVIYPAIARAAHVQGRVVVLAVIDEKGHVIGAFALSGPPMLIDSALQGIRQYAYSPFQQDGKPETVATVIGVDFTLWPKVKPEGSALASNKLVVNDRMKQRSAFFLSYFACNRQTQQGTAYSKAVELCQDAVQKAEMLSAGTVERGAAYLDYANALLHNGNPGAAIEAGNRAVAAAKANSYDVAGASAAYTVTGEALALTGNLQEADRDFSAAEKDALKAIRLTPDRSPLRAQRSQVLKSMLEYHANVLAKMGKQEEAQKKLKEAAKL